MRGFLEEDTRTCIFEIIFEYAKNANARHELHLKSLWSKDSEINYVNEIG
jgi:hypothetical protein